MVLPSPSDVVGSRTELFLAYLTFFRGRVLEMVAELPDSAITSSILPSQWTPLGLVKHLTFVEMRWLEWGFEGQLVAEPWSDRDGRRFVTAPGDTRTSLVTQLERRGRITNDIVRRHDLDDVGAPGERWDGANPATLERVLFHLLQEYARHVGHLDICVELVTQSQGE